MCLNLFFVYRLGLYLFVLSPCSAVVLKAAEILPILAPYCFLEALCVSINNIQHVCFVNVVLAEFTVRRVRTYLYFNL